MVSFCPRPYMTGDKCLEAAWHRALIIIQYIRIGPNGLVLSPCPHSVPSDLSPHSHFVPGRTPQGTDAWKPHGIGLWEVRKGRGTPEAVPRGTKGDALRSQHPWASGTKRPVLSPFWQIYATLIFSLTPLIIEENGDKTRNLSPKPMDTGFGGSHFVPSFVP